MDIIKTLMAEATVKPSRVTFRKIDHHGNMVSVKFNSGMINHYTWGLTRMADDEWEWYFGGERVSESRARELLLGCEKFNNETERGEEKIDFPNGCRAERENGLVVLSGSRITGASSGVPAKGRWVLRDHGGNGIDIDSHLSALVTRHPELRTKR